MAERRMFSKKIMESDEFLALPASAQLLYFHLCMEADDDGFLGKPKAVVRASCGSDADLRRLMKQKYLITFPSGVVVIRHWRVHNQIRKDRYHETYYQTEFQSLTVDASGVYQELPRQAPASFQPVLATEVRIGQDRLDEISSMQERRVYPASAGAALERRIMEGRATADDFAQYRALFGRRPDTS